MSKARVWAAALGAAAATLATSGASAEEIQCHGRIGAVALDNVFVPDGASCVLDRTRMNGSVVVGRGARLQADGVSINGNLQAEGASFVGLGSFSTVGGSVQIVQGGAATIDRSRIKGDLQFDSNSGALAAAPIPSAAACKRSRTGAARTSSTTA